MLRVRKCIYSIEWLNLGQTTDANRRELSPLPVGGGSGGSQGECCCFQCEFEQRARKGRTKASTCRCKKKQTRDCGGLKSVILNQTVIHLGPIGTDGNCSLWPFGCGGPGGGHALIMGAETVVVNVRKKQKRKVVDVSGEGK